MSSIRKTAFSFFLFVQNFRQVRCIGRVGSDGAGNRFDDCVGGIGPVFDHDGFQPFVAEEFVGNCRCVRYAVGVDNEHIAGLHRNGFLFVIDIFVHAEDETAEFEPPASTVG